MTCAEIAAYNQGVRDVLALAQKIAERVAVRSTRHHHTGFATEALMGLASEQKSLLLPELSDLQLQAEIKEAGA